MPVYGKNKSPTNTRNFSGPNFGTNHSAVRSAAGCSFCAVGSSTERVVVTYWVRTFGGRGSIVRGGMRGLD